MRNGAIGTVRPPKQAAAPAAPCGGNRGRPTRRRAARVTPRPPLPNQEDVPRCSNRGFGRDATIVRAHLGAARRHPPSKLPAVIFDPAQLLSAVLSWAIGLVFLYLVIRLAVRHAIQDAAKR